MLQLLMLKVVLVKKLVQSDCEMAISVMEILEELLETEWKWKDHEKRLATNFIMLWK